MSSTDQPVRDHHCPDCGCDVVRSAQQCPACGADFARIGGPDLTTQQGYVVDDRVSAEDGRVGTVIALYADGHIVRVHWDGMTNRDGTPFVTDTGAVALKPVHATL